MKKVFFLSASVLLVLLTYSACKKEVSYEIDPNSLYSRLGGIDAISAVTDQFLANVAADNAINARFAATVANPARLELLRNNLIDQLCEAAGGPCKYKGKNMRDAHKGMNITQAEFNALVADLVAALDKFKVPQKEKSELLGILGPMQSDIVGQ